jgi:hypothetical protein
MLKQLYKAAINIAIEKVLTKLPVVGQAVNAIQVAVYTVQNKLQVTCAPVSGHLI